MKLAATLCCAALSLTGCATEDTSGGGFLEGMRPAKPSLDNPDDSPVPPNPVVFEGMEERSPLHIPDVDIGGAWAETISPQFPVPGVCDDCQVIAIHLPRAEGATNEEVRLVSDGGVQLCRIYLNDNGSVDSTDCKRTP